MRTIRGRLLATLLIGMMVVLVTGGAAVYWIAKLSLKQHLDERLESQARTLASLVSYEGQAIEIEFHEAPPEILSQMYFELRTSAGDLLMRSENLAEASLPVRMPLEAAPIFGDANLPHVRGRAIWLAFQPRADDDADDAGLHAAAADRGIMVLAAAVDREPTERTVAALLGALVAVGVAVSIAAGVLVIVGVRWALAPLQRLSGQLAGVNGRTMSTRFDDASVPRELEPVYRELNHMLDRVERTLERERNFADAAAHELRTPLAELRTTAEVAMRWPDAGSAAAALNEALVIGGEMERLVESLLLISRAGAGASNGAVGQDEVDLASIVQTHLGRAEGLIREKRLTIALDLNGHEKLRGPRDALDIVLRNLIKNAVDYTLPGGRICIRSERGASGSASLIVENDPVHLTHDDVSRIFEPFWRKEASHFDRQHAGLGLAVVHRIAAAVGLTVAATLEGDQLQIRVSMED